MCELITAQKIKGVFQHAAHGAVVFRRSKNDPVCLCSPLAQLLYSRQLVLVLLPAVKGNLTQA
ncbi:Uncharacterised protein [Mycobacteroides abscessus subsp. abscessus]|nr:Uncharacterised protein [Mycobacteroides abscessus subsp. abscessus]